MSYEQYKLERMLTDLQNKESPDGSTCLISLYVPPDRAIADFVQELTDEVGTATNIRSKFTQKNVVSALRNVIGKLKLYGHKSPESGIAIFAGATADSGHKDYKIESYVFEPPQPISRKLYVCDNRFHVEYLVDRLVEKDTYALLAIDSAKATIATLKGDQIEIVKSTRSGAAKKHRKGGQSSVRFARLREEVVARFLKRVADDMKQFFIEDDRIELKGVILGGPGQIKDQVVEYFDNRLKAKVVGIKDLGYGGDRSGINELVAEIEDILEGVVLIEEKRLVQQFLDALTVGKANYGEKEVRKNLQMGAVEILLVSKGIDLIRIEAECQNCGYKEEKTVKPDEVENYISVLQKQQCSQCNVIKWEIKQKDLIMDLGDMAEKTGATIEIINPQTEEGRQIQNFGGICAILRYIPS
ncbi:MAG: peptide chain release factor 1 [Candidatus Heimdallarchaeota archaeon]|nr:MAG: peptide chain release factor 1 [Candidatus Heimdallarchaeota archaeon]